MEVGSGYRRLERQVRSKSLTPMVACEFRYASAAGIEQEGIIGCCAWGVEHCLVTLQ
jgi:hypothetical protein